jgi:hypothetical protein
MQKVVGSSPIIRFENPPEIGGFCLLGWRRNPNRVRFVSGRPVALNARIGPIRALGAGVAGAGNRADREGEGRRAAPGSERRRISGARADGTASKAAILADAQALVDAGQAEWVDEADVPADAIEIDLRGTSTVT